MPNYEIEKGTVICTEGSPISELLIITKGNVEIKLGGKTFLYTHGDVPGIWDLSRGIYSGTYTAATDVTLTTYPYRNLSALETLFQAKPAVAYLLVCTISRQLSKLLQYVFALRNNTGRAYEAAIDLHRQYGEMCKTYAVTAKKLAKIDEIIPFSEEYPLDEWIYMYYSEIMGLNQAVHKSYFGESPGIALGFVRKAVEDSFHALNSYRNCSKYLSEISHIFANEDSRDLFAHISELHLSSINIKGADSAISPLMQRLTGQISYLPAIDQSKYQPRLEAYVEGLKSKRATQVVDEVVVAATPGIKQNLVDSMSVILEYSGCPVEVTSKLIRNVDEFKKLSDKNDTDEEVRQLRKELTQGFYTVYQYVLVKTLDDPKPPTVVNMFLNFGYLDAELSGVENADYLYSIADAFHGDPNRNIFTLREWMLAIYDGKKEPSKSELDEDYSEKINDLKKRKEIDDKEARRLLADTLGKLRFEMENVFPVTNKVTSGTVSTFCPIMSSHTIMRSLESVIVTSEKLSKTLDEIRDVDFSAYYRDVRFETLGLSGNAERIHIEVLPEIILMPNFGTRGIMWQEITGRDRTTPARMFIPMFAQSDLKSIMVRLTGDFRWEMCKRIQGARWSDITTKSLTSEICDYLQFYMSNRSLSSQDINTIRNELSSARNNFKMVFSSYYSQWVQYESRGLARFNKTLRRIMMTYCPFTTEIRESVRTNPQFAQIVEKYNNTQINRGKIVSNLIQKVIKSGKRVPQELKDELEFTKR